MSFLSLSACRPLSPVHRNTGVEIHDPRFREPTDEEIAVFMAARWEDELFEEDEDELFVEEERFEQDED